MDELSSRIRSITVREVSLFALCCVATYLLRIRQSYGLGPAWRFEADQSHFENGRYAQLWETLPSPVIADVESDGLNELLVATSQPHLQLLKIPSQSTGVLPYMTLQKEVTLVTREAALDSRQPKALATGYLDPFRSMLQIRAQVIVVVTADWTVLCFDHNLNLVWETQLMRLHDSRYYIREISVVVTSHNIKPDDGGLVIVGASLQDRHHKEANLQHDHRQRESHAHKEEEEWQGNQDEDEGDEEDKEEKETGPVVNHFSTFALTGRNGTIRWHHLPGDFEERRTNQEDLFSAHHFKLALRKGLSHAGEQLWSHYSKAILNNLPHRWQRGSDTTVTIARVVKDTRNKPQLDEPEVTPTLATLIGLDGDHMAGYHFGGLRPHSSTEHVKNPNAVVIHMHQGVEVLDLATGRPITRLKLTSSGPVTYADVNGNGIVDQIQAHFTADDNHKDNCMAIVRSGIPPQALLFNGSICAGNSLMDSWSVFGSKAQIQENLKLAVAPVTVPSIAKQSGVINHLLGGSMFRQTHGGWDSVFLISNGRVTSYGPKGHFNWKVDTKAKWNDILTVFKSKHYFPQETIDRYHHSFQPSMQAVALKVFGKMDAAVLVGWDYLVIVSLEDGHVIADHSLPCQPTAPTVVGDFNSDGYNDVIVQCSTGLLGFRLEFYTAYWSTALIGLCLVAVVLGLTALCSSNYDFFEDGTEHAQYVDDNHQAR
ncbi:uncharacterized protein LOC119739259 isoform X2 [Patiria miniata]|uniref:Uncharacterized protein n=1 Tax=Patiria miniata TaxID=46514 RepID=A0A914B3G2_PATMI|nr:uncharacterized protein LOC119739259 isoform X2 [Patiria miniata]